RDGARHVHRRHAGARHGRTCQSVCRDRSAAAVVSRVGYRVVCDRADAKHREFPPPRNLVSPATADARGPYGDRPRSRVAPASGVVGPFAPSTISFAFTSRALRDVSWLPIAAGTNRSHSTVSSSWLPIS